MIKLYVDAATNTERGKSAGGVLLVRDGKQTQLSTPLLSSDNHTAEFQILLFSLDYCIEQGWQEESIFINSDSKTVVSTLDKNHTNNPKFSPYLEEFNEKSAQFTLLILKWVPESQNKGADHLAKQGLLKLLKSEKATKRREKYGVQNRL